MKVIHLRGVDNVRDVGGTPTLNGRVVAPGLFFRGAALCEATDADGETLRDELGITHVVDVRCGWERADHPNRPISGVTEHHIPFYDAKLVGIEYTEPAQGTKRIGRDVACDPKSFYRSLANELTVGQMRRCIHLLLDSALQGEPVYFHCSGGKDRAGVLAFLLLTILGATPEAILDDYLYTNVSRDAHYERTFRRFLKFADGNEALAHDLTISHRARRENLDVFCKAVEGRYGSMEAFIREQLAVDDGLRTAAQRVCTISTEELASVG